MFFRDIEDLVREKAHIIGIPCNDVTIEVARDSGYHLDAPVEIWPDFDHDLVVRLNNAAAVPWRLLEPLITQQVCIWANHIGGIKIAPVAFHTFQPLAQAYAQTHAAYIELYASRKHVRTFGQESFDRFWEWHTPQIDGADHAIRTAENDTERFLGIVELFKQQMRQRYATRKEMPPIMKEMIGFFPYAFEVAKRFREGASDAETLIARAKLISVPARYAVENADIVRTYCDKTLVLNEDAEYDIASTVVLPPDAAPAVARMHEIATEHYMARGQQYR